MQPARRKIRKRWKIIEEGRAVAVNQSRRVARPQRIIDAQRMIQRHAAIHLQQTVVRPRHAVQHEGLYRYQTNRGDADYVNEEMKRASRS